LTFVATQDLRGLGANRSEPVSCTWQWWYHLPRLSLWVIVGLALVLPRANRTWQAWLILIPVLLVLMLWRMPLRLVSAPASSAASFGAFVVSLTVAWTVVWLLGHRLARRRRMAGFFLALGVMLALGIWAYMGEYGFALDMEMLRWALLFGGCALTLLTATGLARLSCRRKYVPGRFMAWLFLWMLVVSGAVMLLFVLLFVGIMIVTDFREFDPFLLVTVFVSVAFMSVFLAFGLYLFNLPFMILAFKNPFYRGRLRLVFGLRRGTKAAARPIERSDVPLR
jgi:hypothetical protein